MRNFLKYLFTVSLLLLMLGGCDQDQEGSQADRSDGSETAVATSESGGQVAITDTPYKFQMMLNTLLKD